MGRYNARLVLSLPSAGLLRHHKSRFLAIAADGIWIECPPDDRALIDDLIDLSRANDGPLAIHNEPYALARDSALLRTAAARPRP